MKIHSDTLSTLDVRRLTLGKPYYAYELHPSGSRKRKGGFEVFLAGSSRYAAQRRNEYGSVEKAATYEEWGELLAELFDLDPQMIAGPYKGVDDFNAQTDGKFS